MKIGMSLSGGGARGIAHVGVLKALDEMGIDISIMSGTSAGSIVAALYAYGHKPDQIFELVKSLSLFRSVRPAWTRAGLLSMDGMKELLLSEMPENNFSALKMPLVVAATEIRKGHIHYFSSGELIPTILASCCIPAIFSPITFEGGLYVDGGIFDNLPSQSIRQHCELLIGSHCNQISPEFDALNMKVVIERSLLMAIYANTYSSRMVCDVFIEPPRMDRYGAFDVGKAQEIFEFGYHFTKTNFFPHHFQKMEAT